MVAGLELKRRHVDDRVLPDLRIDQPREGAGEQPLQQAGLGERLAAPDGLSQA